jgi:hypothetical protein
MLFCGVISSGWFWVGTPPSFCFRMDFYPVWDGMLVSCTRADGRKKD